MEKWNLPEDTDWAKDHSEPVLKAPYRDLKPMQGRQVKYFLSDDFYDAWKEGLQFHHLRAIGSRRVKASSEAILTR